MNKPLRFAFDLGSTSLGWAVLGLKQIEGKFLPDSIIKAGVRIFSDGRDPQSDKSLAVNRREKRVARRRRDRLLKRKNKMMRLLVDVGFFPKDLNARKALEKKNPYALRAKALDEALSKEEMARAIFHLNQRRGFKSNRKSDSKETQGALKTAIADLTEQIDLNAADGKARTLGEFLWRRMQKGQGVRARHFEEKQVENGKSKIKKYYDLYVDRAMVEAEFDAIWAKQMAFSPNVFTAEIGNKLKDCLLFQRKLRPVQVGRCSLEPEKERAPLALPLQQRFRILQEVNNLRILNKDLSQTPLSLEERNILLDALEKNAKRTFIQIKKLLQLPGDVAFNLESENRTELKGNASTALLSKKELFGAKWFEFSIEEQTTIVEKLLNEESEPELMAWLEAQYGFGIETCQKIARANLPEGYGNLSKEALEKIVPELEKAVITYDKAVLKAGYEHHSRLNEFGEVCGKTFDTGLTFTDNATGEVKHIYAYFELPYYGECLTRHVSFGSGVPSDSVEKRFGKIANPTVHIALNQVRLVVNALLKRYGHPKEIIIELARDLKQSKAQKAEAQKKQKANQERNNRLRKAVAKVFGCLEENVKRADIERLILWEELSKDPAQRRCPYSGKMISIEMALNNETQIEHILPFSRTLDDSLNNKTLSTRKANQAKARRTPFEAKGDFEAQGWHWEEILQRVKNMPHAKQWRFLEDAMQKYNAENDFAARALNDTRYLSRIAKEYLSFVCPQNTRAIPGAMTAKLRKEFGLNDVLGLNGEKNRNDHRHHAVDACVIGITDQGMLQRFAKASADAEKKSLQRLVENMPLPWSTYRDHVQRAVDNIFVSHKPDHNYEGQMLQESAHGLKNWGTPQACVKKAKGSADKNNISINSVVPICEPSQNARHGVDSDGNPLPYKAYVGGSNYCIEIVKNEKGKWQGEVISTFKAYQIVRQSGEKRLRDPNWSQSGKPLVMRLMINDCVRMGTDVVFRVVSIRTDGRITFAPIHEANVDKRNTETGKRKKLQKNNPLTVENAQDVDNFEYTTIKASSLQKENGRKVTISPIGQLREYKLKE